MKKASTGRKVRAIVKESTLRHKIIHLRRHCRRQGNDMQSVMRLQELRNQL